MDFSKMRHRITFLKPTGSILNDFGETVPDYQEYRTVWAYVAPKTGREYDEAQKIRSETTYNIITRYHDGITANMKIQYKQQIFNIISVLNVGERNEELQIVATETDNYGT